VGRKTPPTLSLVENPDILATIAAHQQRPRLVVGFAAETGDLEANAEDKLRRKGCDWIVANPVDAQNPSNNVFGSSQNKALLLTSDGREDWPAMAKTDLAKRLVGRISQQFGASFVSN